MKNYIILLLFLGMAFESYGQCDTPDPSIWENTWLSCSTSENPNLIRGKSHWILYDLGRPYPVGQSWVWNTNETGLTNQGMKEVIVDYSMDGENWEELGSYAFAQAPGQPQYGGFEGPDFGGKSIQYILITAVSNWGNSNCTGLAEVKFNLDQLPVVLPKENPIEFDELGCRTIQDTLSVWFTDGDRINPEDAGLPPSSDGSILSLSRANRDIALISFEGDQVEVYATKFPQAAFGSILLDNRPPETFSWSSTSAQSDQLIFKGENLGPGKHSILVVSHGVGVNVDYLVVCRDEMTTSVGPNLSIAEGLDLTIFPNPTTDKAWVQFGSGGEQIKSINVFSAQGNRIQMHNQISSLRDEQYELDFTELPNGTYFVRIINEENRVGIKKVLVQR